MAAVVPPNLGLYLGSSPLSVPSRAVQDGRNFRIKQGRISNLSLGWIPFFVYLNDAARTVYLTFSGAPDTSTVIKDFAAGKTDNHDWTAAGNAQIDTAVFDTGGASLLLDGTGDWISHAHHADFVLGSDPWAIELKARPDAATTAYRIAGKGLSGLAAADLEWFIERNVDDTISAHVSDGTTITTLTSTDTVDAGSFTFVALTYDGTDLRLYVGDALQDTQPFTGPVNSVASADLRIGIAGEDTTTPWDGWIDNFSLSVGEARFITDPIVVPTFDYIGPINGPVAMIDTFFIRGQTEVQFYASLTDLYRFDETTQRLFFFTPTYTTGTVAVSGTAVTGTTTTWLNDDIKPGDYITFRGSVPETDPFAPWYEIEEVGSNTSITLANAVTEGGGTIGGSTPYTIRRTFTGALRDVWDNEVFVQPDDGTGDDLLFITNGVDPIVKWDGQAPSAIQTLTDWRARRIATWKNMMLYGWLIDPTGDVLPTSFINSDVGKPEDIVNGLAGQFRIHDGVDHLIEMEDLGDNMVFYSERHVTLTQFVGDPLVFVFRQASTGIGPFSPRQLADFGDYHEFIGADTQYLFDGVAVTEVGKQVWREILRLRDPTRHFLGFSHFDEENGDLLWLTGLTTDAGVSDPDAPPDEAFVEHYLEEVGERVPDPVSRRQLPFCSSGYSTTRDTVTWNELTTDWQNLTIKWNESFLFSAFPINLFGGVDGQVYIINVDQMGDGVPLPSYIRFGRRSLGDGRIRGLLTRVYPFMTQLPDQLRVTTRYTDHASGPITQTQTDQFDQSLPPERHFVTPYRRGRYFELEVGHDAGLPWEMEGYDVDGRGGGRR